MQSRRSLQGHLFESKRQSMNIPAERRLKLVRLLEQLLGEAMLAEATAAPVATAQCEPGKEASHEQDHF